MYDYYSELAQCFPYSITTEYLRTEIYDPEDSIPFVIMIKDNNYYQAYSHAFKFLNRDTNNYYKISTPEAAANTKLVYSTYVMWEDIYGKDLLYQIDTFLYPSMDLMLSLDKNPKIDPDINYQLVMRYLISYKNTDDSIKIRLIPNQLKYKLNNIIFDIEEFKFKNLEKIKKIIQNKQDYIFDFTELIFDRDIIYSIFVQFEFYKNV
jgi:hypothetical protein